MTTTLHHTAPVSAAPPRATAWPLLARFFATDASGLLLLLRLTLALVIFPHGAQKLLGWFGGFGFSGTMGFFTETMGIPALFAFLAIVTEFFGPLALAAGFLSRLAALGIGIVMTVAVLTTHLQHGFFMNWTSAQAGEGFEYHLLALGLALALLWCGGGRFSADRALARRFRSHT